MLPKDVERLANNEDPDQTDQNPHRLLRHTSPNI